MKSITKTITSRKPYVYEGETGEELVINEITDDQGRVIRREAIKISSVKFTQKEKETKWLEHERKKKKLRKEEKEKSCLTEW